MSDALALLEEEFRHQAASSKEARRLHRLISAEIAAIEDLTHRTTIEMARLRTSRDSLRAQLAIHHKWLRASAAGVVREKLKLPAIPGYISPVDELVKRRLDRRQDRARKKQISTTATAIHPTP